jgi:glutamate:GABA antiporter
MSDSPKSPPKKSMGVLMLSMISVAAVLSVRNYPSMADEGWQLITWYFVGSFLFLLPLALVSAELASAWPSAGGIYSWIQEAFNTKTGFMSIWAVVVENIPWYPTVLSFIAVSIAYIFSPDPHAHILGMPNNVFLAVVMLVIWWGLTLFNFLGPTIAAKLSSVGTILGAIIPSLVLIILGLAWIISGRPSQLPPFSWSVLIPKLDIGALVYSSSIILTFAGIEMSGYYASHVSNPQKSYPRAMFLATIIIFILSVLGTLPIAIVIPLKDISLNGGVIQVTETMFSAFGMSWAVPVMAILLAVGGISLMSTWMLGPLLSMVPISQAGTLPKFFRKENKHGSPTGTLMAQGILITFLALAMALIPGINEVYWVFSSYTTTLLCIYYLPIFAAVIKLRYTKPEVPRPFKIIGGTTGVWIIAGVGSLSTIFSGIMALNRPAGVTNISSWGYFIMMVAGTMIWMLPFWLFRIFKKPGWAEAPTTEA